jgi:hypothetical protein
MNRRAIIRAPTCEPNETRPRVGAVRLSPRRILARAGRQRNLVLEQILLQMLNDGFGRFQGGQGVHEAEQFDLGGLIARAQTDQRVVQPLLRPAALFLGIKVGQQARAALLRASLDLRMKVAAGAGSVVADRVQGCCWRGFHGGRRKVVVRGARFDHACRCCCHERCPLRLRLILHVYVPG